MQYDYYKYQVNGETWHLIRVSTDLALAIALEKAFVNEIIDENGPGKVIPVRRNSYAKHVGYLPLPYILDDVNDGFNWEARVWGNTTLELNQVKTILHQSFWKRIEADGNILSFKFSDNFLFINNKPVDITYDIIEDEGDIWIVSGVVKHKIIDINQDHLTLHDGRFVFILTKVS